MVQRLRQSALVLRLGYIDPAESFAFPLPACTSPTSKQRVRIRSVLPHKSDAPCGCAAASMLAPVFPGCHVICRPATYHGIEPPPFLPSLDKRAGIEPALSLLAAGGDPGFPLVMVIVQACPRRSRQPAIWHQVTSRITTAHSPTRKRAIHAACLWVRPGFGVAAHAPVQFCTPALFLVGPGHLRGPGYGRFQGGSWAYHSPQWPVRIRGIRPTQANPSSPFG